LRRFLRALHHALPHPLEAHSVGIVPYPLDAPNIQ
jgi:hypothetical protein